MCSKLLHRSMEIGKVSAFLAPYKKPTFLTPITQYANVSIELLETSV